MQESYKIGHSRCPKCAENGRDTRANNLAEYSDGHSYCFACGYAQRRKYFAPKPVQIPLGNNKNKSTYKKDNVPNRETSFHSLVDGIRYWRIFLSNKGILPELWEKYGIKYNEETKGLCFSVPEGGIIERSAPDALAPKWMLRAKRKGSATSKILTIYKNRPDQREIYITLVEDIISAIRIAEIGWDCYPLLGVKIDANDLLSLSKAFGGVAVWLDRDKRDAALRIASRASQWNPKTTVITSDRDPKEYNDEELRNFLSRAVSN